MPMQGKRAGEECFVILLDVAKVLTTEGFDAASIKNLTKAA